MADLSLTGMPTPLLQRASKRGLRIMSKQTDCHMYCAACKNHTRHIAKWFLLAVRSAWYCVECDRLTSWI